MTKPKPLVSVLVPTRNSEKYLGLCLNSLKVQSYPKIEIIVIDRNSQDNTLAIAKKLADKVIPKIGPERSAQVNHGAKKAKGKYLYRVDSDFTVDRDHIKNMVEKCESEGFQAIATYNLPGSPSNFWTKVKHLERSTYLDDELIVASRFFTKKIFDQIGGFDENLVAMEDYDLHNRLVKAGCRFGHVPTFDYHLAEPNSLQTIAKSNFYYGETRVKYFLKHPQKAFKQALPIRASFIKHWRKFVKQPHLSLGVVLVIMVMYLFSSLGFLNAVIKKRRFR